MKTLHLGATSGALLVLASLASGQVGVWTNVHPPTSPPFRIQEGLGFDPVSGLIVAYGGSKNAPPAYDDTWAFDGATWTQLFPTESPGERSAIYLVQSPNSGRLVLFGGVTGAAELLGSTWELDVQALTWTDMTPAGPSPSARELANLVYDSARDRVVLFGGGSSIGGYFYNDTWEWDGSAWHDVTPTAGPSPSQRAWHTMAYDSARGRTVLFGGYNGGQLGDTWEWDGAQWTQIFPANSPSARSSGAIAYDPESQRVVLFAGSHGWPIGLNDTWEYDGTNWFQVSILGDSPPPQFLHRMVGDPIQGGILMYGAFGDGFTPLNDTWRYHRTKVNCSGDPGFTLTVPTQVGIGEVLDICMNAPGGDLVALLGSLGQGPTVTAFGTFCLDFPPLVVFTFVMPGTGARCFHPHIPCDPGVVGVTGYLQFLALDPSGAADGISNQQSVTVVDNGGCG